MNILTRQELLEGKEDYKPHDVDGFLNDMLFLKEVEDLSYNQLSNEQIILADELLDKITRNSYLIISLASDNFYTSRIFNSLYKLIYLIKGDDFEEALTKHLDLMEKYIFMIDDVLNIIESKEDLTISDIELAHELSFLGVISLQNDIWINNQQLLKLRRYKDFAGQAQKIKQTVWAGAITLKMRNNKLKNN